LVQLQHPIQIETAGDVSRQTGEEKPVGNHQLPVPERRQDDLLDAMAEIGAVQQREFFGAERAYRFPALDDRLDQIRLVPLRRDDVVAFGFQPRLE